MHVPVIYPFWHRHPEPCPFLFLPSDSASSDHNTSLKKKVETAMFSTRLISINRVNDLVSGICYVPGEQELPIPAK
jgi:hypothetical protein